MAEPASIRRINRREVLMHLLRSGTASRSGLARASKLSPPTIGKIIDELLAEGIVEPASSGVPSTRMGRPGHETALRHSSPSYLAVQIGPTTTRLARLAVAPPASDAWDCTFETMSTKAAWQKRFAAAAKRLAGPTLKAVLVSVPGIVDEATGTALLCPNVRWLEGQSMAALIETIVGLPTHVVQEIRCLALGQLAIEPAVENFLLVDFGTGVGASPVIRGRLLESHLPLSGEIGHTPVPGNDRVCGCGGIGCLETLVGRKSLPLDAFSRAGTRLPASLSRILKISGSGIAAALNVVGLDRVVITGHLADLPPAALQTLRQEIETASIAHRLGAIEVTTAPRRRLAGLASVGIDRCIAPAFA